MSKRLPKVIDESEVERLLGALKVTTSSGLRNRAAIVTRLSQIRARNAIRNTFAPRLRTSPPRDAAHKTTIAPPHSPPPQFVHRAG